jgi:gluconate 5-dehydrogenase
VPGLLDLTGKTALITGSSGSLGLAMARGLAEAGARVVLNGRDCSKLAAAAETLQAAGHWVSVTSCKDHVAASPTY